MAASEDDTWNIVASGGPGHSGGSTSRSPLQAEPPDAHAPRRTGCSGAARRRLCVGFGCVGGVVWPVSGTTPTNFDNRDEIRRSLRDGVSLPCRTGGTVDARGPLRRGACRCVREAVQSIRVASRWADLNVFGKLVQQVSQNPRPVS